MSNYHVEPADRPKALASEAIKSLRTEQVKGSSRRQLLRYSIGGAMATRTFRPGARPSASWPGWSMGPGGNGDRWRPGPRAAPAEGLARRRLDQGAEGVVDAFRIGEPLGHVGIEDHQLPGH